MLTAFRRDETANSVYVTQMEINSSNYGLNMTRHRHRLVEHNTKVLNSWRASDDAVPYFDGNIGKKSDVVT